MARAVTYPADAVLPDDLDTGEIVEIPGSKSGFNPFDLLGGAPSFQGGDAAPSAARSEAVQTTNAWMFSPFAVGAGASASANVPVGAGSTAGAPGAIQQLSLPLIAVAAIVAIVVLMR